MQHGQSIMNDEVLDEEKKLRRLRFVVDFALNFIRAQDITHEHAISIIEGVKKHTLALFPGKEDEFDIIYAPGSRGYSTKNSSGHEKPEVTSYKFSAASPAKYHNKTVLIRH
ncbi:MAG: hypothetical protein C0399_10425 [Syntrophus sp. (in: bacteria)]|nr:hypothetical protein [Syntrophus sp. (in: bacteria)]